jgi:hypothetical protein
LTVKKILFSDNQEKVNQRPSRKAKTKEAVLKHLNRDVELLVQKNSYIKNLNNLLNTDHLTKGKQAVILLESYILCIIYI